MKINLTKKYNIIYADPPWRYRKVKKAGRGAAENHYNTMSLHEIKKLNVLDIADKNCALLLWATFPCLPEALEVIKAWGFDYKTVAFNWVKRNKKSNTYFFGMGSWTRSNGEICLLATKGCIKCIDKSISQIVDEKIRKHSQKPDIVRDKIVQLLGDLPRIELFSRDIVDGWDYWGNHFMVVNND